MQGLQQWQAEADAADAAQHFSTVAPGWAAMQQKAAHALQLLERPPAQPPAQPAPGQQAWDTAVAALKMAVQLWAQRCYAAAGTAQCHGTQGKHHLHTPHLDCRPLPGRTACIAAWRTAKKWTACERA